MSHITQIDELKAAINTSLYHLSVAQSPMTRRHDTAARWGYIDNNFQNSNFTLGVLFSALEFEIADVKYHPEQEHADRVTQYASASIVKQSDTRNSGRGDWFSNNYVVRTELCELLHGTLVEQGYVVADFTEENHGGGITWMVRYSKRIPHMPMYCYQVRVVYVPCDFTDAQRDASAYHDVDGDHREYVVVNYEGGEITNLDTHDFHTGQLLRRVYVERCETDYDNSPFIDNVTDRGIYDLYPTCGIINHRSELIDGGVRHTYNIATDNDDHQRIYRRVVAEIFDYVPAETITVNTGNM